MLNQDARPILVLAPSALGVYVLGQPEREAAAHSAARGAPVYGEPRQIEWQVEASDQRAGAVRPRKEDKADELCAAQQPTGSPMALKAMPLRVVPERRVARGVALR